MTPPADRAAQVVGLGLIGGSVGAALRERGWRVTGRDADDATEELALSMGVIDAIGIDPDSELAVVAVPASHTAAVVRDLLSATTAVVTDVAGVKSSIVAEVSDPRFVGGHPMAGSEQEGVASADPAMFSGAAWILTPTRDTDPAAQALVHSTVVDLGADVVTMSPDAHDQVVAMVSHVPHLTAATLMGVAASRSSSDAALLRVAAGGFRDMTRIAAGHPGIWPDICVENGEAILAALDQLIGDLSDVREAVANADRTRLTERLEVARDARMNLPVTAARPANLAELRIRVDDRPGVLAEVATIATGIDVNIYDIEIAHSAEGPRGVLIIVVDRDAVDALTAAVHDAGYSSSTRLLS